MATITGKRFQMTDGAATPINLFPYTVSEAVYGLNNSISNAISSALSAISLSTYAGTSAIGSSVQPVYYNGSALVATDLSTTYAPYNSAGYLPLTADITHPVTGRLYIKNQFIGWLADDGTQNGYIESLSDHRLVYYDQTALRLIYHSGNVNKSDVSFTCSMLYAYDPSPISFYNDSSLAGGITRDSLNQIVLYSQCLGTPQIQLTTDAAPIYRRGGVNYTIYHSGNSNKNDVDWTCRDFYTSGNIYFEQSGGIYCGPSGSSWRKVYGCDSDGGTYTRMASYAMIPDNDSNDCWQVRPWNGGYSSAYITVLQGGNVGIGTTSPTQALYVVGNILSTGDQIINSDQTMKMNLKDVTYSVSDIAKCRAVTFDWKDGRGHSAGSIAQDWKPLIPELVHGEEGGMTLAYGQIALVNSILEAREIERLEERVAKLEQQLKMRS